MCFFVAFSLHARCYVSDVTALVANIIFHRPLKSGNSHDLGAHEA